MSHSHFDTKSHQAKSPFLAFGFRVSASCRTGQISFFAANPAHACCCLLDSYSPLLPTTYDTQAKKCVSAVLRCFIWWGQCASSCWQSCCSNLCCQEGRQGSPRAELRWDYEPFDLARFTVVLCFLSHSIMLCLSSTGCTDYKELSLFLYK